MMLMAMAIRTTLTHVIAPGMWSIPRATPTLWLTTGSIRRQFITTKGEKKSIAMMYPAKAKKPEKQAFQKKLINRYSGYRKPKMPVFVNPPNVTPYSTHNEIITNKMFVKNVSAKITEG